MSIETGSNGLCTAPSEGVQHGPYLPFLTEQVLYDYHINIGEEYDLTDTELQEVYQLSMHIKAVRRAGNSGAISEDVARSLVTNNTFILDRQLSHRSS